MENKHGVTIGSKGVALWTKVEREARVLIEQSEDNLTIQKEILNLARDRIKAEKEKFK